MVNNDWLSVYGKTVGIMVYELEKHKMMNTGNGLVNLGRVASFLSTACKEIEKLHSENIQLKQKLVEYKKLDKGETDKEV